MQNKKIYVSLGIAILLVGAAAFVAGRMFNGKVGIVGLGGPNGGRVSISLNDITPAPELPDTNADATGLFVERKDNTIVMQAVSFGEGSEGSLAIHRWMRIAVLKLKLLSQVKPLFTVMSPSLVPLSMARFTTCNKRWRKVLWTILIRKLFLQCGVVVVGIGS